MPYHNHKKGETAEKEKKHLSHLAVCSSNPGIVTLCFSVAISRPKRSCHNGKDSRGLKKHLLRDRIRGDLIYGKKMCDQESVDLEESDVEKKFDGSDGKRI